MQIIFVIHHHSCHIVSFDLSLLLCILYLPSISFILPSFSSLFLAEFFLPYIYHLSQTMSILPAVSSVSGPDGSPLDAAMSALGAPSASAIAAAASVAAAAAIEAKTGVRVPIKAMGDVNADDEYMRALDEQEVEDEEDQRYEQEQEQEEEEEEQEEQQDEEEDGEDEEEQEDEYDDEQDVDPHGDDDRKHIAARDAADAAREYAANAYDDRHHPPSSLSVIADNEDDDLDDDPGAACGVETADDYEPHDEFVPRVATTRGTPTMKLKIQIK